MFYNTKLNFLFTFVKKIINTNMNIITDQEKLDVEHALMHTINRNVYLLRKQRKWSQQQLADAAGIQPYQVCYIEGSHYYKCRITTLAFIAHALGVRVTDLTNPDLFK